MTDQTLRPLAIVALTLLLAVGAISCSDDDKTSASTGDSTTTADDSSATTEASGPTTTIAPVTREVLAQTSPPQAPGYDLYLYRVTIQPGTELASHHHAGTQIGHIQEGTLTYTIETGTAGVARDGEETASEEVGPGEVILEQGDTVYENIELYHHAKNNGDKPVVVLLTTLIEAGQPLSIPTNP